MSIQKKSLISALKTTKKANVAKEDFSHAGVSSTSVKSATRMLGTKGSVKSASRMLGTKGSVKSASRMLGTKR